MKRVLLPLVVAFFAIQGFSQTVQVLSPNGGENWIIGCPATITWVTTSPMPVKIELFWYTNSGVTYSLIIASSVPAGTGTFTWIPPASLLPGNNFKVKVSGLTNPAVYDLSDNFFSISAGTITVVSPNGGETWYKGGTYQILWTDNLCTDIRIELWKGGVFHSVIAAFFPSGGSFTWTIPNTNTLVPGNDYKVKIKSFATNATSSEVFDFSDNNFTISGGYFIKVTSPNGGEVWVKGTTHIITWQDNIPWDVRIELWKGGAFNSLITTATPSTGSCYWAIPATIAPGNDYKIKILATLSPMANLFDFSDDPFTILGITPTTAANIEKPVLIYPNPVQNTMHVRFRDASGTPLEIDIFDIRGVNMIRHSFPGTGSDNTLELNTSGFAEGIYLVIIRQGTEILARERIVIRNP